MSLSLCAPLDHPIWTIRAVLLRGISYRFTVKGFRVQGFRAFTFLQTVHGLRMEGGVERRRDGCKFAGRLGFPQIMSTLEGVAVFWGLYWGPPI